MAHGRGSDGGECVEVADGLVAAVPVRDSKNPHGPVITFPAEGWDTFIAAVRRGDLGA
ncbi:DUF397 domain-containing protein [Streptomyces sp. S07_1.15]|uniref:DUF397 domain-containing protein n=1 Tax=Streptomyces sp. S07_1.15 TaxID=2873925 RepID=UPI001D142557|nr:DUF397 domain-containing protein [Streptomyces sp. S07_1.15]MCC3650903.1 DUF397 domain-containing protein [Streptomyces sp. S07_1.15]